MTDRSEDLAGDAPDDDALRWAGDDDLVGPETRTVRRRRTGGAAESSTADAVADRDLDLDDLDLDDDSDDDLGEVSSARRALTIVAAVLYLLIFVGWVMSVQYTSSGSSQVVVDVSWQFGEFMAMASAPLVFLTVRQMTSERPLRTALLGWLVGAVILLPWPILVLLARGAA